MPNYHTTGAMFLAAVFALSVGGARAFDETRFPNWKGQWVQVGGDHAAAWDPTKPPGAGQQAPLAPEYQARFKESVEAEAKGGPPIDPTVSCIPAGMPRVMMAVHPMEIVITPAETYFVFEQFNSLRGIYTDGRRFPDHIEPSFIGYSIGRWQGTAGDGLRHARDTRNSRHQGAAYTTMLAAFRSTRMVRRSSLRSSTRQGDLQRSSR